MIPFRSKKYQKQMQGREEVQEQEACQWIMRREQLPEYRFALEMMGQEEKERVFWDNWKELDEFAQRDLVKITFGQQWDRLLQQYSSLPQASKVQVLEALGYIHCPEVVQFLMGELCRQDDSLRLAAAGALQRQEPVLIIEPMLEALDQPEQFLASRIYGILMGLGPKLVPVILQKIPSAGLNGQIMMVQLLGAFGDSSVLDVLEQAASSEDYLLKKVAAESLIHLGVETTWPILQKLLQDENWQIRLMVTEGLKRGNITAACPALREALCRETDPLVRESMEEVLYALDAAIEDDAIIWSRRRSRHYGNNSRNAGWRSRRFGLDG